MEIETLDIVEITSSTLPNLTRNIPFALPPFPSPAPTAYQRKSSLLNLTKRPTISLPPRPLMDPTGSRKGVFSPVQTLRTERPAYPRQARELGWEGTVTIQAKINEKGTVEAASIHKSSGHQTLDHHALQTIQQWRFIPAYNGNFPVHTTVNIPVKFDLRS